MPGGRRPPEGLTVKQALESDAWRGYVEATYCTLEDGHDGPHRTLGAIWHDPPIVTVGGKEVAAIAEPEHDTGRLSADQLDEVPQLEIPVGAYERPTLADGAEPHLEQMRRMARGG